ncbi:MAG: hypothetical protein ABIO65_05745 [Nitrospiria bacterium]
MIARSATWLIVTIVVGVVLLLGEVRVIGASGPPADTTSADPVRESVPVQSGSDAMMSEAPAPGEPSPESKEESAPKASPVAGDRLPADGIRRETGEVGGITGNSSGKVLLALGDSITLRFDGSVVPQPGQQFALARRAQYVEHPITGRNMGWVVHILGQVEVQESFGKYWNGRIVRSSDYTQPGDMVLPMDPDRSDDGSVRVVELAEGTQGYIVAVQDDAVLTGTFQTVYTDLGLERGLKPHQEFSIIRDERRGRKGGPRRVIGALQLMSVQSGSSSAWVIRSDEPVEIGDRLEPKPAHAAR